MVKITTKSKRRKRTFRAENRKVKHFFQSKPGLKEHLEENSQLWPKMRKGLKIYSFPWMKSHCKTGWNDRKEYNGNKDFGMQCDEVNLEKHGKSLPKKNRRELFF
jgi:hypothetical protein